MRSVILHRNNTVRGMQHNLFIDSNPEADTRRHVSGLPLTFCRMPERNATINVRRMTNLICS